MPFNTATSLPEHDILAIEAWIRELKPDVDASAATTYWAFKKPVRHDPPQVQQREWVSNEIDNFILSKLEANGLSPAPEADRRTLIRRLYFNVIGLPPPPEEVAAFVKDPSPTAYENLLDRLLADPRYGERWARHWLDLARYADTNGYEGDRDYPHAWRYRDYVIDAFNHNKPYDKFIKEQIAGDEFFKVTSAAGYPPLPEPEQAVALTFLRLAPFTEPRGEESRDLLLSEMLTTVSSVFLGLTMACAKCHDHKYDPIPSRDFYRMKAFFATVRIPRAKIEVGGPLPADFYRPGDKERFDSKRAEYKKRLEVVKTDFEVFHKPLLERLAEVKRLEMVNLERRSDELALEIKENRNKQSRLIDLLREGQLEAAELDERNAELDRVLAEQTAELKKVTADLAKLRPEGKKGQGPAVTLQDLKKAVNDEADNTVGFEKKDQLFTQAEKDQFNQFTADILALERALERLEPMAMSLTNFDGPPYAPSVPTMYVLIRGQHDKPGEPVEPGFPSAITGHSKPAKIEIDRYKKHPSRNRRMALARWIASPENPLTARVMVNRLWQYNFGRGIVETASNFGKNGKRPSHPELLDWLALRFVDQEWSVRAIQRLILTSSTFRQSSFRVDQKAAEVDLENRLLWRFNRRRLEAEGIRDSILAISGRLNTEQGGPPIFPPLPTGLNQFTSAETRGAARWDTTRGADARKRSIYVYQRRSQPLPFLEVFDSPPLTLPCERREVSVTPLQALAMYDGEFVNTEAEFFAERVAKESGSESGAQIRRAFQLALARDPEPKEVEQARRLFSARPSQQEALVALCRVLFNSNELLYID
ncbi:DUF1553 domain-containing protein [Acidobacteria bacterium AH-259-G07]|nr:DUF1553 domain-containing protein [Acidobacteria bacterium AH-259-G07]